MKKMMLFVMTIKSLFSAGIWDGGAASALATNLTYYYVCGEDAEVYSYERSADLKMLTASEFLSVVRQIKGLSSQDKVGLFSPQGGAIDDAYNLRLDVVYKVVISK